MSEFNDDNYFFDNDAFDTLPTNTLQQLERDAVSVSQHPRHAAPDQEGHWPQQQPLEDFDFNMTDREPPSSDYGFDEEDVIDLDEPSLLIQPASGPSTYVPALLPAQHNTLRDVAAKAQSAGGAQRQVQYTPQHHDIEQSNHGIHVNHLQARVAELERERAGLQKAAEDAKSEVLSKAGEISIVRAKHDKATKEYERKLAVMQKLHAEEAARQKAEIEATRKERETVKMTARFLEHDLAQEVERSKRLKGPVTSANTPTAIQKINSTPKKSLNLPYRDGFDDEEIVNISPPKSKEKLKAETPKAGAKRKRQADASPVIALQLSPRQTRSLPELLHAPTPPIQSEPVTSRRLERQAADIKTMQMVLNHTTSTRRVLTVEALAQHAFSSVPSKSLSTLLLQDLSSTSQSDKDQPLSVLVCKTLVTLMSKCLSESHYEPLGILLDLFELLVSLEPSQVQTLLVEQFVPVATKAIDRVAVPRATAFVKPATTAPVDKVAQDQVTQQIDAEHLLEILQGLALSASLEQESATSFWQSIELHFVLLMLNKGQPLPQIVLFLQMLATSTLPTSFGATQSDLHQQSSSEMNTIDRLTTLMFETPAHPLDEEPYDGIEIAHLRIEILRTLQAICSTEHGSTALAQNRTAIARLFRLLYVQVELLYGIPPKGIDFRAMDTMNEDKPVSDTIHGLTVTSINLTVRLLYRLLQDHPDTINLREKLGEVKGGWHKFEIALTRLAFSERLVFEEGIEVEVVEAAEEILNAALTPEEGDALVMAFETPRASTSTRASMPRASAPR